MTQLKLRILGGFSLAGADGTEISIPGKKAQALLAYLALNPGQKHSREKLATLLWGDRMDEQARHSLRQALLALRKVLAGGKLDPLTADNETATLNAGFLESDVEAFESNASDGTPRALEVAVALYAGPLLEGLRADAEGFDDWLAGEQERMHALAVRAMEGLAEHQEQAGQAEAAIDTGKRLLTLDSSREEGHRLLMRLYAATGRRADALRQYKACVEALRRELDAEPSVETVQLYDALREGAAQTVPTQTPMQPAPLPPVVEPQGHMVAEGGERRVATLTLHKLHGLSALNRRMDPEEVERIINTFTADAGRIVKENGGTINPLQRDEMEVLFGIPIAHEDDPMRAVKAALALHGLVERTFYKAGRKGTEGLRLSTGISTGLTVARAPSSREGAFKLTGEAMDTAARLMGLAKPGRILVGGETGRLVEPFFDLSAFPPSRGKKEPVAVQAYQVEGETPLRTRFQAAEQRGLARFAGRENEMSALREALALALAGRGQFITVVGEAGIGKTRLMHQFRTQLDDKALTVLEGRAHAQGGNTPYLPFLEALRKLFRLEETTTMPETAVETVASAIRTLDPLLEEYLPFYLHLLSISSEAHPLSPNLHGEELRRGIQLALVGLFTRSADLRPLVFLLDDWHWADEASDAALKYLIGLAANFPLLVVAAYRPEFSRSWGNPEHYTPIVLRPFDGRETVEFCRAVLNVTALPDELAAPVTERTGGNPFFVEELCHALIEEGTVVVENGQATLTQPLEAVRFPETVHGVIRARVDRLDPEARDVLRYASVIGLEFGFGVLERVHPHAARLAPTLERLWNQDLIQQVRVLPDAAYRFKNTLTQVVVYETLLLQQRRESHALVGRALEAQYAARLEEHIEPLAYHFERGEVWDKAADYLLQAAEKAKLHWAYAAASEICRRALTALEKGGATAEQKVRALVLAGDLESLLGNLEEANQNYDQALEATTDSARRRTIENKHHRQYFVTRDGAKIAYYLHGDGEESLLLINP
ncbi:MAG: AAA family ATPase, partial [bacterium]